MRDMGYRMEHGLAWLMSVGAIALLIIGALVAFDVFSLRTLYATSTSAGGSDEETAYFLDGMLLIVPGIALGLLALCLHMTDHHGMAMRTAAKDRVLKAEHGLAYLGVIVSIAMVIIGIVVGYDIFDSGYSPYAGLVWGMLAIGVGALSTAMHAVRHHEMVTEEDDIRRLVEDRVGIALQRAGTGLSNGTARRGSEPL